MLKQQVSHSHSYGKSLFTWRGMQAWCLGRRASGLCRFFIRIRSRPKLRLASIILSLTRTRQQNKPQAFFLKWLSHTKPQKRTAGCCLSIIKREGRAQDQDPDHHQHHNVHAQSQKPITRVDDPHDDVHVKLQKPYEKFDGSHAMQQNHEFSTQLGNSENSIMSCLQRQSSSGEISFNSLSKSSTSSSSSLASGSFPRVSGSKLRETCAKVVHGSPSICELVAGNQFLVHLSAAPVVAVPSHSSNGGHGIGGSTERDNICELNPSMGVVTNTSLRHKDADLNDRIVFFK